MPVTVPILGKDQIFIGYDIIDDGISLILNQLPSSTYVMVTDTNIAKHDHLKTLKKNMEGKLTNKQRLLYYEVPPGEMSKSRKTKAKVEDFMLLNGCTRDTVVLAVGGGVIGDMIGYVASTFMRGVKYVQIPTTLLAMVDSSIGGKTAIDVPNGKNLVGSFWQPELNIIELRFLETLPRREFLNGMAEVVKTAAIWNNTEFKRLEDVNAKFMHQLSLPRDKMGKISLEPIKDDLLATVCGSVKVKAEVVTLDEREGGLRNILNFGHSIGHAYEAILTPHVLHGECVAIGSVLEAELSRYLGHLSASSVARLIKLFKAYELPVSVKDKLVKQRSRNVELPLNKLIEIMAVDKKNAGSVKRVVLLSEIGKTFEPRATPVSDLDISVVLGEDIQVSPFTPELGSTFTIVPPGSKSISNRVLVLCALANGTCRVTNLLHSDDTGYMLEALTNLGAAKVDIEDNGDTLVVTGFGGQNLKTPNEPLYLGNAGTAARFLTAVAALVNGECELTGNQRMQERPIGALVDALKVNGTPVDYLNKEGSLPLRVQGGGKLKGGRIELGATVSSQYVSALLMVAPYAKEPVTLKLTGGKPISQFYIDMTIAMMRDFGLEVLKSETEEYTYHIPQGSYTAPKTYTVESDASSATYPLAFAAMTGTECTVPTIGSASLQGDAKFAVDVLGKMGCLVTQTKTSTTVKGVTNLKAIDVDMEPMTDAFLTACVVAAISTGTTRITGIANQHVKECDRIQAMTDELKKFGVECVPSEDGIEVIGVGSSANLKQPTEIIHSYDDHRVAMSLSLLAIKAQKPTVIDERRCVEKTWPGWWDTLHTKLGAKVAGLDPIKKVKVEEVRHSVVFVGMRGAGKTSLAQVAADVLQLQFIDVDQELQRQQGTDIKQIIEKDGWETFRRLESEVLKKLLKTHATGYAIACGGGIVESAENVALLKQFKGKVVHVHRNLDDIIELLNLDKTRPAFIEDLAGVYKRREPLYEEVSDALFWQPKVNNHNELRSMIGQFFKPAAKIDFTRRSYFLSLTFDDLSTRSTEIRAALEGCNAVELRVDLLKSLNPDFVAEQVSQLRLITELPIIFTVRSQSQGGKFDDNDEETYLKLLKLALKLNVEFIDVELTMKYSHPTVMKHRGGRTQFIVSHHDPKGTMKFDEFKWQVLFFDANRLGDIVKFVGFATEFEDNFKLDEFKQEIAASKTPFIGINMGHKGQLSRVMNEVLTPVTHKLLQVKAAPGQLSIEQINQLLTQLGGISKLQFFVTGSPIEHSQSPNIHNSGYKQLGLPHTYTKFETTDPLKVISEIKQLGDEFGGASVTIPLKSSIIEHLDSLSSEAEVIGAVNTITPVNGKLLGSNTDYIGIVNAFAKYGGVFYGQNALVIGAGGTALAAVYAFKTMGFQRVFIINRTQSKIDEIAKRFKGLIEVLPWSSGNAVDVCLSCIPGNLDIDAELQTKISSAFKLKPGTLLEAAYKPALTEVMKLAQSNNWKTIPGKQMLVMQGVEQFRIWTGFEPLYTAEHAVN